MQDNLHPSHNMHNDLNEQEEARVLQALRMVVSACLVSNNADLIEPDVLNNNKQKYAQTLDEKYISKAHRRGKVGWNLGKQVEMSPHIRVPHMALRWTGVGRKTPKMVMVKGAVIHKELIEQVPTGEMG